VNNTNLHLISLPIYHTQHWSNYRFCQEVPQFNALVFSNLCEYRHTSYIAK